MISGLGLTGLGGVMDREPGYAVEARQSLRNLFTSPEQGPGATNYISSLYSDPGAIARNMSSQLGSMQQYYEPYLMQQENRAMNDLQTRALAGLPASLSTAMQGSELQGIKDLWAGQLLPQRQALLADMARQNLDLQLRAADRMFGASTNAAGKILDYSSTQNNPLADAIAKLGAGMMAGGGGGGLFGGGAGGAGGASGMLQQLISQLGPQAMSSISAAFPQLGSALAALAPAVAGGGAGYFAAPWLTEQANKDSPWRWLNPTAAGAESLGANDTWLSGITGAQSGAVAGFVAGGPVGAIIGALAGIAGGLTSQHKKSAEQKAAFRTSDLDSQRDQILELGNIGSTFMKQFGATQQDFDEWQSFVMNQPFIAKGESGANEHEVVSRGLGQRLLSVVRRTQPAITSLDQVPGLRTSFIDYLRQNTFTAGNSSYGGGAPESSFPQWANLVGLQEGGTLPFGGPAIVGERGPEMMMAGPGTTVMPMGTDGFSLSQGLQSMVPGASMMPSMPKSPAMPFPAQSKRQQAMRMLPKLLEMLDAK